MKKYMTPGSFEITVKLADLAMAQKDNKLDEVQRLVSEINSSELVTLTDVNFNTLFNPYFNIINESYFYIIDNIHGLMDREIMRLNAEIYQLRQHGDVEELRLYVDNLVAHKDVLEGGTITLIANLIGLCIQFQAFDSLTKLRTLLTEMGQN